MQIIRKKVLAVLLSMVMAATMLVALPTAAHAATATIDVTLNTGDIGDGTADVSSPGGDAAWNYVASEKRLYLTEAGGEYTLTGTNTDFRVLVAASASNAEITLDDFFIEADSGTMSLMSVHADCILTVSSFSQLLVTNLSGAALGLSSGATCTINGNSKLNIVNAGDGWGIRGFNGSLSIGGSVTVEVIGGERIIDPALASSSNPILIGDDAKLILVHDDYLTSETYYFQKSSTADTHQWKLTDATLASGSLTSDIISITVAPHTDATIERELIPPTPPTITSANTYSCVTGTGGSFPLAATGTTPITFGLSGTVPAGVSISGSSLVVAATVAPNTYNFTVTATNGVSPDATQAFTLTVAAAPVAPAFTSANSFSCVTGTGGSFPLTATGTAPITWSLSGTVPAGVSISGSTLVVAGSVPAGDYSFEILASNEAQSDVSQQFTLKVTAADTGGNTGLPATGDNATLLLLVVVFEALLCYGLILIYRRRQQKV